VGIKVNIDGEEIELVNIGKSKAKTYNVFKVGGDIANMEKPPVIVTVHVMPGWKPSMGARLPGPSMLQVP
jgi:hypothetical protein